MTKPRVVIVDDDQDLVEELGETMTLNGYDVETVSDPAAAVEVIKVFHPDVVLLDLKMGRMDGFAIADALSRDAGTSGIPIIAMTGFYGDEEIDRLRALGGVKSFLTKPFTVSEVMEKVFEVRRLR